MPLVLCQTCNLYTKINGCVSKVLYDLIYLALFYGDWDSKVYYANKIIVLVIDKRICAITLGNLSFYSYITHNFW